MIIKSILRCGINLPALALCLATGAHAQAVEVGPAAAADATTNEAAPGDIIVTGSRIRQNPLEQRAPVIVVDQAALAQTGLTAVADVLQRLPSAAGGLNTKVNNSGNIGNPQDGGGVANTPKIPGPRAKLAEVVAPKAPPAATGAAAKPASPVAK